jgi:hypothetical protein
MRQIPRIAAFFLALGIVLPVLAADEKKPDAKKDLDKTANAAKWVKQGEIVGKIVAVYEGKKALRLQVQEPTLNAQLQVTMQAKDYELQTTEDLKVRLSRPPAQFDDKGKVKKYTAKELREMRGPDHKLPGYTGEFSDLQTEQVVQVTLVRPKGEKPVRPVAKPKKKDSDADWGKNDLPLVSMIVVVADPTANTGK